jgi:hypothetical protein
MSSMLHDSQQIDMAQLWRIADRLKGTTRPVSSILDELEIDTCPEWVTYMLVVADLDACPQCSKWVVISKGPCPGAHCS